MGYNPKKNIKIYIYTLIKVYAYYILIYNNKIIPHFLWGK
jgi:hypothetical protein